MTSKLFTSGLFAGLAAGLIAVLLQIWLMEPLILQGEAYETGAKVHFGGVAGAEATDGHDHATHDHSDVAATADEQDENLTSRFTLAFFAEFVTWAGFGLVMVTGFALAARFGHKTTLQQGLLWGIAGFVSFQLMPGLGLSPELPGVPAADLQSRQIWWFGTVIATAIALGLFAFGIGIAARLLGLGLLLVPHLIGAPHLQEFLGTAPPGLAAEFVTHSFVASMAAWVTLGTVAGYLWHRNLGEPTV